MNSSAQREVPHERTPYRPRPCDDGPVGPPALAGGFEWQVQGFQIIDVIILVALVAAFAKKPAQDFLKNRHEAARKEMDEAMSVKTSAQARLDKYEGALANLTTEIEELNTSFRNDGEREAERITQEGQATIEKLRRDSAETLNREGAQLKSEIERSVAIKALDRAESLIQSRLDEERHKALIEAFIFDLESRDELGSFSA